MPTTNTGIMRYTSAVMLTEGREMQVQSKHAVMQLKSKLSGSKTNLNVQTLSCIDRHGVPKVVRCGEPSLLRLLVSPFGHRSSRVLKT